MLARLARGRGWLLPGALTSCLKVCESVQALCRACQLSQITNLLAQPFSHSYPLYQPWRETVVYAQHVYCCSILQLQNLVFIVAKPRSHLIVQKLWGEVKNTTAFYGEGNGNPLQYSCLEKSMHRGVWRAEVHGIT